MHWSTKLTVVDIDTGEQLTKKHVEKGIYIIIKKHEKYNKITDWHTEKVIRWECTKNPQQTIW